MPEVPGIREVSPFKPFAINQTADMAKGQGITEKSQALVKEVVGLLATDRSVRVTNVAGTQRGETGTVNGPTGAPSIDNPDDAVAKEIDLEKLIMYLQLANAEEQAQMAQDRINSQKDTLAASHKERMKKLTESLEKMDKAAKSKLFNKIFGWLMAAVAVVVAVAACVATGGIAVGPVIGAAIALGACILDATGAMDKITEALAKGLEKLGLSKEAAQIVASIAIAVVIMAASLGCCASGASVAISSVSNTVKEVAEAVQKGANIAMKLMGVASLIGSGTAAGLNYASGMSQAELTEMSKVLAMLQQQLEESEDELQKILELIQNVFTDLVAILNSETDTQKTIAQQMSQMA